MSKRMSMGEKDQSRPKAGKPVAAVIPIRNTDGETVSLSTNRKFLAIVEHSRYRLKKEGGISAKELRHRLGLH